jgi:exosortase/archaeosortase
MSSIGTFAIRTQKFKLHKNNQDYIKSVLFFFCILFIILFCAISAYTASGPMVLGTELNADGSVEYMCFGNACHDLHNFTWNDKK